MAAMGADRLEQPSPALEAGVFPLDHAPTAQSTENRTPESFGHAVAVRIHPPMDDRNGETESRTSKPRGSRFRTERSHLSACLTTRQQSKLRRAPLRSAWRDAATRTQTGDSLGEPFVAGRCLTVLGHRGRVGRRGFEPRLRAPKARVVVRWTIGPKVSCRSIPLRARHLNMTDAVMDSSSRTGWRTSGNPGNATLDHAGCRPFRARHRRSDSV